jgi:aldose 1-epimerase
MDQLLQMNARWFNPDDAENIPTGEQRSVEGTPFDFRTAKPLGQDIGQDYEPLYLQGGYDHNFEVLGEVCAVLTDPDSGRTMSVTTDCPGIQIYTANFLDVTGKNGIHYGKRSSVCLETQYAPDSVNHPQWPQPFTKAGEQYRSFTKFQF